MAEWKAFVNRAGWSIRYPGDCRIASCKNCSDPAAPNAYVDFFPLKDSDSGWVMVEQLAVKPPGGNVDEWLAGLEKTNNLNPRVSEIHFKIDELPALKVRNRDNSGAET